MVFAVGSKFEVSYIEESTFGVTPSSPSMQRLRITGDSLNLNKSTFLSNELRSDREIVDFRHGNIQAEGDFNFEMAFDSTIEDFFLAALGSAGWSAAGSITSTTLSFADDNPDTINDSGNGLISAGFKAGDSIAVSGSTSNNGTYTIASVTAGSIVLIGSDVLSAEAAGDSVTIVTSRQRAKTGVATRSFTLERRFTDSGVYQVIEGARVNGFNMTIAPNSIVTGSFGILGKGWANATSSLDSDPSSAGSNQVFDSFTGSLKESNTIINSITSVDLTLNNNLSGAFVVGSDSLQQIFEERANLSGTVTAFLEDEVLLNKFRNETETSLELRLSDGTNYYDLIIPRVKFGGGSAPVQGFGGVLISFPFQALRDPTEGASFIIDKSS